MRRTSTIRIPRRGIASLELVLVFPMLMSIVAALFLIAKADMVKLAAATKSRQQTWKGRTNAPAGANVLRPWHNPQDSQFPPNGQAVQTVSMPMGPLFPGRTLQGQSGNTLVANTWDAKGIPFASLKKNMVPHTDVLALIGTDITKGVFVGFQVLFDPGWDFGGNPVLQAARVTGIGLNIGVKVAGAALEYPVGAAIHTVFEGVQDAWDFLNWVTFGFAGDTSEGKEIKKTLDTISTYLDFFHNLYEASQGRRGNDPFSPPDN